MVCSKNYDINPLIQRRFMELPRYTFIRRDAGLIEEWLRLRIKDLLINKRFEDADALYREFDVLEQAE